MKTIGIIGGSGYIGVHLLRQLANDYEVVSLQRNAGVVMPDIKNIKVQSIASNEQTFDIIINTSYNLGRDMAEVFRQNGQVLNTIRRASHAHTRVIHLSSLAVFGFGLDKPIRTGPVKLTNDYAYVMSKVHMENCLLAAIPNERLSIVRLGNVWGPANNSWTQPVADALQWGLPVLSNNASFSNITYIQHINDYVSFLIDHAEHRLFHHLAEFSQITWPQIVDEMGAALGAIPEPIPRVPFYAKNLWNDLRQGVSHDPKTTLKNLRDGRFSSFYFPRKFFDVLQKKIIQNNSGGTAPKQTAYHPDPTFYWILTCTREFKTETLPGWKPRYAWEDVRGHIVQWLGEAGYVKVSP